MKKSLIALATSLMASFLLVGAAAGQETPASNAQTTSATKPKTTAHSTSAAKPKTTVAATTTHSTSAAKPKTTSGAATTKSHPAPAKSGAVVKLSTPRDKTSYALGMNIGKGLHRDAVDIDPGVLLQGLQDGLAGGKTLLTEEEMRSTLTSLQGDLRQKQTARMQQEATTNLKAGEDFLAANKSKEGVVTLPSGLQYKILKEGAGPKPTTSDTVVCNYRGTLLNGTEFDSSYKRGQPVTFPVSGVIKGWTEALQLMPVGSKWELFIPPDLAYGPRGAGADIGPNATLVFEVELVSIQPKETKSAAPTAPAPKK